MIRHYAITPVREIDSSKIKTEEHVEFWQRLRKIERPSEAIIEQLKPSLEMDGYVYQAGHLYPTESAVIDTIEQRTALERLVDSVALNKKAVIKHHIQESERAYAEQRWGHSISDARNILEAILREVAAVHHLKTKGATIPDDVYKSAAKVRDYLLSESLIDKSEQDALWKIYGLISNTGSHPNIAEKDQARLMRYLSLAFCEYVLLQWEGYLKNNP